MKLALGTVQFGIDYGISNQSGQTNSDQVKAILDCAAVNGIDLIDTAFNYGESETVLGDSKRATDFKVVTKTIFFDKEKVITVQMAESMKDEFLRSLRKLNVTSVYGLMIHHVKDLLKPGGKSLFEAMNSLKSQGLVQNIGVSAYDGDEVRKVLKNFSIDIIQLPVNLFDQRLIHSGVLKELKSLDIEVHVRSAFLQGLVFMEPQKLSTHFNSVKPLLKSFQASLKKENVSPVEASLGFLGQFPEIDRVVCGVNNVSQLRQICGAVNCSYNRVFDEFSINDENILNPSLWQ